MSHNLTAGNFTGKFRIPYNGDTLTETIYNQIMHKSTNFKTAYDLKETLNGIVKEYRVVINNGARTKKLNEPLFLEFNVVEL